MRIDNYSIKDVLDGMSRVRYSVISLKNAIEAITPDIKEDCPGKIFLEDQAEMAKVELEDFIVFIKDSFSTRRKAVIEVLKELDLRLLLVEEIETIVVDVFGEMHHTPTLFKDTPLKHVIILLKDIVCKSEYDIDHTLNSIVCKLFSGELKLA